MVSLLKKEYLLTIHSHFGLGLRIVYSSSFSTALNGFVQKAVEVIGLTEAGTATPLAKSYVALGIAVLLGGLDLVSLKLKAIAETAYEKRRAERLARLGHTSETQSLVAHESTGTTGTTTTTTTTAAQMPHNNNNKPSSIVYI